jgi:putative endonuclease
MYYIYILYSTSSDRYYVGYSSDLSTRLAKHNAGATRSTKPYRPWEMVYSESFETKSEALRREKQIKNYKSRNYIEGLISSAG